jgi:hypothetical protein
MKLDYKQKETIMQEMFKMHKSPAGFRSTYKACPVYNYEAIKQFIDFTKYYVMFRGPRPQPGFKGSTRKRYAHSFDVYQRSDRDTIRIRAELEGFKRGVQWAKNA